MRAFRVDLAVLLGGLLVFGMGGALAAPKIYRYDNATSGATGHVTSNGNCTSGTGALDRTFSVSDSFTVQSIAIGVNVSHNERGDYRMLLIAPGGTSFQFMNQGTDTDDNYDVLVADGFSATEPLTPALDDNDADPVAEPYFLRLVEVTGMNFYTGNASGTWTLRLCDRDNNGVNGTFNRAKLILTENASVSQGTCATRMTYDWGSNGNNANFTSTTVNGVTMTETRADSLGGAGIAGNLVTTTATTGNHAGYYQFFVDVVDGSGTEIESVGQLTEFTFSTEVNDLTFAITDNDWADADFEDYTTVAGYDADGNYVPWEYTGGSSTQRAGDVVEGDAAAADTATTGNMNVEFSRPVKRVLIDYLVGDDFDDATLPDDQKTGITDFTFCSFDLGDAPSSYNVSIAGNGPRHVLKDRLIRIGATVPDGETDSAGNAAANVDGADEDGVTTWPTYVSTGMTCSGVSVTAGQYCVALAVTNTSGRDAQLVGWIDFNGDGDFNDTGERSQPRLRYSSGGPIAGADDTTFTTGNVPTGTSGATRVLVWSGFGVPVNAATATYARLRLTSTLTTSFFSDASPQPNGLAEDGEVEDYLLPAGTLPVSLAQVRSSRDKQGLLIQFSTAAEAGNVGFDIVASDGKSLAAEPIAAGEQGTLGGDYVLHLPGHGVSQFYIDDLAMDGSRKRHGPFEVGKQYGTARIDTDRIDWQSVRDKTRPQLRGKAIANQVLLGISQAGIQRLSFADLKAAGLALGDGVATHTLALRDAGAATPLFVIGGEDGVFGPGDTLEFVASGSSNRYSSQNQLLLSLNGSAVLADSLPQPEQAAPRLIESTYQLGQDRVFNLSLDGAEPWLDESLLAFTTPVALRRTFTLPGMAPLSPVSVTLRLLGGTDFAVSGPDHSVVASVNSQHRSMLKFDGVVPADITIDIPEGFLPGTQELALDLPSDLGLPFDLVHFDQAEIRYQRYTHLSNGRFDGTFEAGPGFALTGVDRAGSLWALGNGQAWRMPIQAGAQNWAGNPALGSTLQWFAAATELAGKPTILPASAPAQLPEAADFLIISHPSFLSSLDDYVNLQRTRGYRPVVVSTAAIYALSDDQEPGAQPISDFIRASHAKTPLKYVTLIGADTYDYRNNLGIGSVSFVPTHYVRTSLFIAQTPSDSKYVDFDDDQVPDVAIGRIPARTPDELVRMIRKIKVQDARRIDRALFVAGADDSGAKRFNELSLDFASGLPISTNTQLVEFNQVGRDATRQSILDGFNSGMPLISYTGHTAPGLWDFNGLLFSQDAATFRNGGAPSLVTQWGCWNSYFVDPYAQGLSHQLLAAEGGAGTVYGATTLTEDVSHSLLGRLFFEAISAGARTVGEAEIQAKRRLATLRPQAIDAQLGMQVLGDPAMPVRVE
ncbi:hypothetical protein C7S18_01905 [Ahniella affigens]|uniref:P/Homo B domain-containing protein n=1 Tax=Ahniella affigens TaxID=2021234 RepID=A0A2P1PMF5_9GAMM|nr:C25 family cysteine peptidase [Ahniella affigens]AVP96021.1 hypothetical protein C7S18_01905 [Ahniella affigens]